MNSTIRELDKLIDAKLDARDARARQGVFAPAKPLAAKEGTNSRMVTAKTALDTNKVQQGGASFVNPLKPNPAKPDTFHGGYSLVDSSGLFFTPWQAPNLTHRIDAEGNELIFQTPAPV